MKTKKINLNMFLLLLVIMIMFLSATSITYSYFSSANSQRSSGELDKTYAYIDVLFEDNSYVMIANEVDDNEVVASMQCSVNDSLISFGEEFKLQHNGKTISKVRLGSSGMQYLRFWFDIYIGGVKTSYGKYIIPDSGTLFVMSDFDNKYYLTNSTNGINIYEAFTSLKIDPSADEALYGKAIEIHLNVQGIQVQPFDNYSEAWQTVMGE